MCDMHANGVDHLSPFACSQEIRSGADTIIIVTKESESGGEVQEVQCSLRAQDSMSGEQEREQALSWCLPCLGLVKVPSARRGNQCGA